MTKSNQYNDSFDEELNCKENIISLCNYCHDSMHYGTKEFKEHLLKLLLNKNKNFSKFNLSLEDLKEIYFTKKKYLKIQRHAT